MIERLQNEPVCKYDVPAWIAASTMFSFDKCMRLPAFELYLYCFAHCMMNSTQQLSQQNCHQSIHNCLLSSYHLSTFFCFEYFIPVDGSYPPVTYIAYLPTLSRRHSGQVRLQHDQAHLALPTSSFG